MDLFYGCFLRQTDVGKGDASSEDKKQTGRPHRDVAQITAEPSGRLSMTQFLTAYSFSMVGAYAALAYNHHAISRQGVSV